MLQKLHHNCQLELPQTHLDIGCLFSYLLLWQFCLFRCFYPTKIWKL